MSRSSVAMKQEGFFISDEGVAKRKKIVRQDRWQLEAGRCFLEFQGTKAEVLNISTFGCAIIVNPATEKAITPHFLKEDAVAAKVFFDGTETQNLQVRKVRDEAHPTGATGEMIWALEVVGEPFKTDRIKVLETTTAILRKQNEYTAKLQRLPESYRQFVFQMRDWFEKLKAEVDQLEKDAPVDNIQSSQEYRATAVENISDYLSIVMAQIYTKIPSLMATINPEDHALAVEFIREQVGHYFWGAPFAARAYYKPRGYAGDYEMMNHLYRADITGRTLFDQCVHKFFLGEPPGAAVKNRGAYLATKLQEMFKANAGKAPLKIMSVASGPAFEQQIFLQNSKEFFGTQASFTCLDQDEESLKHAQKQIGSIERFVKSGFEFNFKNLAIRNVIAAGLPDNGYDLIYSAGLFDYLTDPVAQMAAQKMMASLKPGGKLIIGNFSTNNSWAPLMELILDWNLIYRSPEDMERLFKPLGSKIHVEKEPLGVNLFAVIQK